MPPVELLLVREAARRVLLAFQLAMLRKGNRSRHTTEDTRFCVFLLSNSVLNVTVGQK